MDKTDLLKYRVLFCDLDNTIIKTISKETFPKGIWDMQFNFELLKNIVYKLPNIQYLFIVSNQGGIETGFVNINHFQDKFEYILSSLKEYFFLSSKLIDIRGFYCTSNDKNDFDRKPNVGMLEKSFNYLRLKDVNLHKECCLMIGDASGKEGQFSNSDKLTAENFNIDYIDIDDFINI